MNNENDMSDFMRSLFGNYINAQEYGYSESDIISMYIDGRISKEEFIERMNNARGNKIR
jgi:hypothetical protein